MSASLLCLLEQWVAPAAVFAADATVGIRNEAMTGLLSRSPFKAELEDEMARLAGELSRIASSLTRAQVRQWARRQRTARRHTEGVLRRLRLTSRQQVAPRLLRSG